MKYYNISTLFVFPLIQSEIHNIDKEKLINKNLINTYLIDPRFPQLETLIAVYNKENKDLNDFYRTEGKITSMNGLVTYHITINKKLQKDYKKILKGEYSKLSTQAKLNILEFWDGSNNSFLNGVLNKTKFGKYLYLQDLYRRGINSPKIINFEYWHKPDISKETIKLN